MTMILQLLVAAVAVGLSVAAVPTYKEHLHEIIVVNKTLQKNVLSMEGNIPLLNDSRRHYAEIVHVINYHGERHIGGVNYYEEYYPYLNVSAPEALNNPELVVTEIKNLRDNVHNKINVLEELINACIQTNEICNKLIDDTVRENPKELGHPAAVLLAAGDAATDLNELNEKFEEVSKNLNADQYVCTSPEDLKNIVFSTATFYQILNEST